ncbi:MAG: hypothetical protein IJH14_06555 [Solobacterium sp.]|nr:hypothetical protein [Solobacterium sp.]
MSNTNSNYYKFTTVIHIKNSDDNNTEDEVKDFHYIKVYYDGSDRRQLTGKQYRDLEDEQKKRLYLSLNKKLGAY